MIIVRDSRVGLRYFRSLGCALPLWNTDPEATNLPRRRGHANQKRLDHGCCCDEMERLKVVDVAKLAEKMDGDNDWLPPLLT